jgi:hypothetical protein
MMTMKELKEKFCWSNYIFLGDREVQWFHEMTKEANGLGKELRTSR